MLEARPHLKFIFPTHVARRYLNRVILLLVFCGVMRALEEPGDMERKDGEGGALESHKVSF